jgi:hypothetical protein
MSRRSTVASPQPRSGQWSGNLLGEFISGTGLDLIEDAGSQLADLWLQPTDLTTSESRADQFAQLPVPRRVDHDGVVLLHQGRLLRVGDRDPLRRGEQGWVGRYVRTSSYFSSAQNLLTSFQHTGDVARSTLVPSPPSVVAAAISLPSSSTVDPAANPNLSPAYEDSKRALTSGV